ncbi:hypothetical protein J4477_02565 [Candidatus Pacearchaeota archaeon]|nr:hypothetical protein [Candidatus Pacearchaeota archaeon]
MIITDIETSGLTGREGIWQIGCLEFENPDNYFLEEGRIDNEDLIDSMALKLTGKTEAELRNPNLQSQEQLIRNYLKFVEKVKNRVNIGVNIGWDISMIQDKAIKYGIHDEFLRVINQRAMDLHTLAQEKYWMVNGVYLTDDNGRDVMNLSRISEMCGIEDNRMNITGKNVVKEGEPHDALEDCRLEAECYSRIKFGRGLLSKYTKFEIPENLRRIA